MPTHELAATPIVTGAPEAAVPRLNRPPSLRAPGARVEVLATAVTISAITGSYVRRFEIQGANATLTVLARSTSAAALQLKGPKPF